MRSVGFWGLTALVLNGMLGAGIFGLPASVAQNAGSWAPLIVLLVGIAMLPIVLVVARLAGLFDGTGGPILYVEAAFGKAAAFQIGWMQILSTTASMAANVNLLADYAQRGWGTTDADTTVHTLIVLAALLLVFVINLNRTSGVARTLAIISVAKLLPLGLLVLLAIPALAGSYGSAAPPATHWSLSQAALLSAYAFTGFEGALTVAGEARAPRRDLPRALLAVFATIGLLYALLVWGYVATAFDPAVADKAPLSSMAAVLLGSMGALLILATATVSIFGNVTNNILFISRRLLALESLGGLPRWLGRVHGASGVPRNAVCFGMLVLIGLSLSGGFAALATLSVASRLIVYLGCTAALPIVERRAGLRTSPGTAMLILLAALCGLALIAGSEAGSWAALGIAVAAGAGVYIASRTARARALGGIDPTVL